MSRVVAVEGDSVTYMDDIFYLNNMVESQAYLEKMKTRYLNNALLNFIH